MEYSVVRLDRSVCRELGRRPWLKQGRSNLKLQMKLADDSRRGTWTSSFLNMGDVWRMSRPSTCTSKLSSHDGVLAPIEPNAAEWGLGRLGGRRVLMDFGRAPTIAALQASCIYRGLGNLKI